MDKVINLLGGLLMNSTVVEIGMALLVFVVAWSSSCRRHRHCHFAADLLVVTLLAYQAVEYLVGLDMARPFWMAIDGVAALSCAMQWSENRKPWWMFALCVLFVAQMSAHVIYVLGPAVKWRETTLHISVNVLEAMQALLVAGWPFAERQCVVLRRVLRSRRRRRRLIGGMARRQGGDLSLARSEVNRR